MGYIQVWQGRNLAAKDSNGLSDPYVKYIAYDDKGKKLWKIKSTVEKKTLNPDWGGQRCIVPERKLKNVETVNIEVWDKDTYSSDDFMGKVVFPLRELVRRPRDFPKWTGDHSLSKAMNEARMFLGRSNCGSDSSRITIWISSIISLGLWRISKPPF